MCMFSRPIHVVAGTQIFARSLEDGLQALVYQMKFAADEDLAMVLPLPVPPGSAEDAIEFVDLSGYDDLFDDLDRAFPEVVALGRSTVFAQSLSPKAEPRLEVHDVGDFEASFVPGREDFGRLDPRFRLPDDVLDALDRYADWGFAVFKLRAAPAPQRRGWWPFRRRSHHASTRSVHPMAMRFPRRDPRRLFFPTVHVHDGTLPPTAPFDHAFYCQTSPLVGRTSGWERSTKLASATVRVAKTQGLIDGEQPLYKWGLFGERANVDTQLITPSGIEDPAELELGGDEARYRCQVQARLGHLADEAIDEERRAAVLLAREGLGPFVARLDARLRALTQRQAEAWRLGPTGDDLPRCQVDGMDRVVGLPVYLGGTDQPVAPMVLPLYIEVPGAEGQRIELGFAALPSPEQVREVREALTQELRTALMTGA